MSATTQSDDAVSPKGGLFRKYVLLFVVVVSLAVLLNGAFEVFFYYREHSLSLVHIQREQAEAAAAKIEQFVQEIENQLGWSLQLPWSSSDVAQRHAEALRLLRQMPAITELMQIDGAGVERLRISRLAVDVVDSGIDRSQDERFKTAMARKVFYGPVNFRRDSEPYMSLALSGRHRDSGVSVAELNLKSIWDVVSQIKVGVHGRAYVVDQTGRLIAHPDIRLVLRNTDMSRLKRVREALEGHRPAGGNELEITKDLDGRLVLTAFATVPRLNWIMVVELPANEAYSSLYDALKRLAVILFVALVLATGAGIFLARRMVGPIRILGYGAARVGQGDLSQRISVKTGDELETLADQFNHMAHKLNESYSTLERKVEQRTQELGRSVTELKALGEVTRAINSTLNLQTVLDTIVAKAAELASADWVALYAASENVEPELRATYGVHELQVATLAQKRLGLGSVLLHRALSERKPLQISNVPLAASSSYDTSGIPFRSLLVVPLHGSTNEIGALIVGRNDPSPFAKSTVDLLETFSAQSALAVQNARLFQEIEQQRTALEEASRHKSQFLANMSHELRTPLNAILGYAELVLDNIYGEPPQRMRDAIVRVQANGKHLLGLINDVLDLSKIEAGHLNLSVIDYSVGEMINNCQVAVEPLAKAKKLALVLDPLPELPPARGDERRITQVLLNLLGNAIKFTDDGEVKISAFRNGDRFGVSVTDTGPGIDESDQRKIFEEFQQADSSITKAKGGTGLGLAIARRIVEMHGGRLFVKSAPGQGSTFTFELPFQFKTLTDRA